MSGSARAQVPHTKLYLKMKVTLVITQIWRGNAHIVREVMLYHVRGKAGFGDGRALTHAST
eukprot:6392402-Pyramimonas_sp.AAC.1